MPVDFQGPFEGAFRFVVAPQIHQHDAEIAKIVGHVGVGLGCPAHEANRLFGTPLLGEDGAEKVQGIGMLRVFFDDLRIDGLGIAKPARVVKALRLGEQFF